MRNWKQTVRQKQDNDEKLSITGVFVVILLMSILLAIIYNVATSAMMVSISIEAFKIGALKETNTLVSYVI